MVVDPGSQIGNLWKVGIVSIIWVIWMAISYYIFEDKDTPMKYAFSIVWQFI